MKDIYENFIASIETRYGPYSTDLLDAEGCILTAGERNEVRKFLSANYPPVRSVLEKLMTAIKEHCSRQYGPPDVATICKAAECFEKRHDCKIISGYEAKTFTNYAPSPPTPEELEDKARFEQAARKAGIDTSRTGWMVQFLLGSVIQQSKAANDKIIHSVTRSESARYGESNTY